MESVNIRLTGSREFVDAFVDHVAELDRVGKIVAVSISDIHKHSNPSQVRRYFEIELEDLKDLLTNED